MRPMSTRIERRFKTTLVDHARSRIFVLLKYAAWFFSLLSSTATPADEPQTQIKHLVGSIYIAEDSHYAKSNFVVYVGISSVVIIGATFSPDAAALLAKEIRKVTDKPISDVVNVDYNPEYSGGNAYWKNAGANIVATELTRDLLRKEWVNVGNFTRKYFPDYPQVPLVLPTLTHVGNFELQDGNIEAIYLGPSHTPDDIFVYFPQEKVLYAGSIIKEKLGNLALSDIGEYQQTLKKLKALKLDIRLVVSGHWSSVHGPELIDQYMKMLDEYAINKSK